MVSSGTIGTVSRFGNVKGAGALVDCVSISDRNVQGLSIRYYCFLQFAKYMERTRQTECASKPYVRQYFFRFCNISSRHDQLHKFNENKSSMDIRDEGSPQ